MTQLSICMPSHRDFAGSKRAIETALAYCDACDAVLIVSDNSGDSAKSAYWQGRSERLHYRVVENQGVQVNFMSAIDAATTPFVIMMGDDDEIDHNPSIPTFDLAALPADHIGVRPLTHVWIPGKGIVRVKDYAITAEEPGERLLQYNQAAGGDNSAFYSIFRREPYTRLMRLFVDHHPTKGAYCDWSQVMGLFSYGKMAYDPGTIFRYNMEQWASSEQIARKTAEIFEAAGLPADGQKYHILLLFLDLFVFVSRPGTPLTHGETQNAASVTAGTVFNGFLMQVDANPDQYSETMRYLAEMAEEEMGAMERFHIGLLMADNIRPGLKESYIAFYKASMAS